MPFADQKKIRFCVENVILYGKNIENYSRILIIRFLVVDIPPLQRNIHLRKHGEDGLPNNKVFKKTLEACFSPPGLMKALPAYLELCIGSALDGRKKQHRAPSNTEAKNVVTWS